MKSQKELKPPLDNELWNCKHTLLGNQCQKHPLGEFKNKKECEDACLRKKSIPSAVLKYGVGTYLNRLESLKVSRTFRGAQCFVAPPTEHMLALRKTAERVPSLYPKEPKFIQADMATSSIRKRHPGR